MEYYGESQFMPSDNNNEDWTLSTTTPNTLDDGAESDYSLDYEYLGPRKPNLRSEHDADSDASELSCTSTSSISFDMWDEDPYSTNDFTWESNDMRLTGSIKKRQKAINKINQSTPWHNQSFWRKEKGWPKQLPYSGSTTNHDQSANALSLVLSDYGITEKLHAVYRDRIVECGTKGTDNLNLQNTSKKTLTTTYLEQTNTENTTFTTKKFNETHASISLSTFQKENHQHSQQHVNNNNSHHFISNFTPFTKFIQRSQFPITIPQHAYLALGFEPLCLAEKYGYMAIGGVEGEFELYCCMKEKPIKIWGTKFMGKNNVLLMTNAVQIVRYQKDQDYSHFLIACMNDAGVLVYTLPNHNQCHATTANGHLYCHIKCFDHVPINDARISPNGQHLICVGDDACIFYLTVEQQKNRLVFGTPQKIKIPCTVSLSSCDNSVTFSSQYVAWSKSSIYFAHTSDTHSSVLIWRMIPKLEMLYRIDAGGYTYAIQFHPQKEGVFVFSNRYGYIHTVNLDEAILEQEPSRSIRIMDYPKQCRQEKDAIHHTLPLFARHEITMISFRGEKNKKLRILAKINGLQWSKDGCYLYVSTKKRVLAYEFVSSSRHIESLEKMAGIKALSIIEKHEKKRKRKDSNFQEKKQRKMWYKKWSSVPLNVRYNVMKKIHLASH